MNIFTQIKREIQCEYCNGYHLIGEYDEADPEDPDSLFSPVYCPSCGEGFMAMGFDLRIHLQ